MTAVILYILAALLIILGMCLFCPLVYDAAYKDGSGRLTVKWLFGAISARLIYKNGRFVAGLYLIGRRKKTKDKKEPRARRKERIKKKDKDEKQKGFARILKDPNILLFIGETVLLIKRLFNHIKPREFKLNGVMGFEQPHITGELMALQALVCTLTRANIYLQGDFGGKRFDIDFKMRGGFNVFSLIWPLISYILSKPVLGMIKTYSSRK